MGHLGGITLGKGKVATVTGTTWLLAGMPSTGGTATVACLVGLDFLRVSANRGATCGGFWDVEPKPKAKIPGRAAQLLPHPYNMPDAIILLLRRPDDEWTEVSPLRVFCSIWAGKKPDGGHGRDLALPVCIMYVHTSVPWSYDT